MTTSEKYGNEEFFSRPAQSAGARFEPQPNVTLQRIRMRQRSKQLILESPKIMAMALDRQAAPDLARQKLLEAVRSSGPALRKLATQEPYQQINDADSATQYHALATTHYVEPSEVFVDIPTSSSLCELQAAYRHYKYDGDDPARLQEQRDVARALADAVQYLENRWFLLTGRSFSADPDPTVRTLTSRVAPVPWSTVWDRQAHEREANALGHEAAANNASVGESVAARTSVDANACDIEQLYLLAGAQPPRQPGNGEPRYTFPGRLNTNEDIYYDYAVVVPVSECGPFQEERTDTVRDTTAAKVLGGKALQIASFLEDMQLADALGFRDPGNRANTSVVGDIKNLIDAILATSAANSAIEVASLRRRIRQMTGLLRAIVHSEMLLAPLQPQAIDDMRVRLQAAINALPAMQRVLDQRINHNRRSSPLVNYLAFPNHGHGDVRLWGNGFTSGEDGYSLDHNDMVRNLGPYLEYLGTEFFDLMANLKARADEARAMLVAIQQPGTAFRQNFEDLASELVYSAIFALAEILEAAAATLTLLPKERSEGSKRLAMLVVYRQHWFPAGYVQGKLVGYKNLAPNQSEKVLRRTFVKSTRETSTVEEFASTRAQEFSQSQKETAEFVREMASKFNLSVSASGSFDILIASVDVQTQTGFELSTNSKATQSRLAEATMKSSVNYNEKREVKVREQVETEDLVEVTTEIENRNQEITANYFYYQLLRKYVVRTELHDLRPVVLRARSLPDPASVDAQFLSEHAHLLIPALPAQLAADVQATVGSFDALSRAYIRQRAEANQRQLDLETGRLEPVPSDPEQQRQRIARIDGLARIAADARSNMYQAESEYLTARSRLDRVVAHVRGNLCYYMQFIWNGTPSVDHDRLLAEETFGGVPLPYLTRGLMRQGFFGNEEIFEFDGLSYALIDMLARNLRSGEEFLSMHAADLDASPTFALLAERYGSGSADGLVARIRDQLFVRDPAGATVLEERTVQLAQDALVVETIPGQVPLLEGFKMAHRMLDLQGKCLENAHLRERIADRPWQNGGEDSYRVYRREGESEPAVEVEPATVPSP